jgi:hypothetical protein
LCDAEGFAAAEVEKSASPMRITVSRVVTFLGFSVQLRASVHGSLAIAVAYETASDVERLIAPGIILKRSAARGASQRNGLLAIQVASTVVKNNVYGAVGRINDHPLKRVFRATVMGSVFTFTPGDHVPPKSFEDAQKTSISPLRYAQST